MREESERRMLGTANSLFLTRLERERPQTSALPVYSVKVDGNSVCPDLLPKNVFGAGMMTKLAQ